MYCRCRARRKEFGTLGKIVWKIIIFWCMQLFYRNLIFMDCSRDLTKSTPLKRAPVIFHWSLMCSVQGGKYKLAAKNYTSFSFPIKATSVLSMQAQLSLGSPVTFAIMITGITNSTFTLYCDTPGGKTVHVIAICI